MQELLGKPVATAILDQIQTRVDRLRAEHALSPGLAVVLVGSDPASQVYVGAKTKMCAKLGFHSEQHSLPADTSQEDVLALVQRLNDDPAIHGILVQSPTPKQIDERTVIDAIHPDKDVDCFHPRNVGKLLIGDEDGFVPCTPYGVMAILRHYGIETRGKHAVILGRSNIVGKPMAALLVRRGDRADCTVTIAHSRTQNLAELTRQADIVVAAIGRAEFVTADMIKPGAVVIDVGINRVDDPSAKRGYRLAGDVDYAGVSAHAAAITPVPGGVGPMTIAMLMYNTLMACCHLHHHPLDLDI